MLRNIDEEGVRIDEDVPNNGRKRRFVVRGRVDTRFRTLQRRDDRDGSIARGGTFAAAVDGPQIGPIGSASIERK
jgi:hypothetical protein